MDNPCDVITTNQDIFNMNCKNNTTGGCVFVEHHWFHLTSSESLSKKTCIWALLEAVNNTTKVVYLGGLSQNCMARLMPHDYSIRDTYLMERPP